MSLKVRFILIMWAVIIPTCAIFTYLYHDLQKTEYLNGVDKKLYEAAIMSRAIMSPDYHDNLQDKNSVSAQTYMEYIDRYNKLCKTLGLQYLWSNLFLGDKVVFTSSTSTSKDVKNGDHALFFDVHSDPHAFDGVRQSKQTHFSTFINEWGMGRMVLKPYYDKKGRMYVFGASIAIDELNQKLHAIHLRSGVIFLVMFIGSTLIAVIASNRIIKPINDIKNVTRDIATGKYGEHYDGRTGSPELEVLSSSINTMSDAILDQHTKLQTLLNKRTDQLIDNEFYISEIVENMAEGVVTIDDHGVFEQANPAALAQLGYTEDEIIGKNIDIIMPADSIHEHNLYLSAPDIYLSKIQNVSRELRAKRKNGVVFPLELIISTMNTSTGTKYIGIVRDITERKNFQQNLVIAKEQAERANEAKSEFLSSMSHELRTPLNAVLGFCQLLQLDQSNELTDDQQEYIAHIYENGKYLLELINEILELSRIESGKLSLSIESLQLTGLISLCISMIGETANKNGIKIDFNKHDDCYIRADMTRIRQVLFNLLSNGIKYNRKDGKVTIDYQIMSSYVRIFIRDTGRGIPAAKKNELFTPFNRLGYEKSNIQGTGIGLKLAKRLVEAMQGKIGFESIEDVGSTFWLDIPLAEEGNQTVEPARNVEAESANDTDQTITVLYIEDNPSNINLMKNIIARFKNIKLITELTARQGISTAIHSRPDVILMDIDLPDINGIEALHQLRENDNTKNIPVIAVSAKVTTDEIEEAHKAGFSKFISKPFNISDLISTIRHYQ